MSSVAMSAFAKTIMKQKYSHTKPSGHKESWEEISIRVPYSVMSPYVDSRYVERVVKLITDRKFIPGGRYLYAAGRPYPQVNNCYLLRAEDSREGWAQIVSDSMNCLMTGGGIGVVYSLLRPEESTISGLGGKSSGPCSLMQIVNEQGRHTSQGGSRRSAIWAGLHWHHPDVFKFISMKDWPGWLQKRKYEDFHTVAPMDGTNISVILDSDFFAAFEDPLWSKEYKYGSYTHRIGHQWAQRVYSLAVRHMLETGEPGFSIDAGEHEGENLRNAPVHGNTRVLTENGYVRVADLEGDSSTVWTGKQWAKDVAFRKTGEMVPTVRVEMTGGREIVCDPSHPFLVEKWIGVGERRRFVATERVAASDLEEGDILAVSLPQPLAPQSISLQAYALGFVYGDGSFVQRSKAEVTICAEEKMPCCARLCKLPHKQYRSEKGYFRIAFDRDPIFAGRNKDMAPESLSTDWTTSFLAGLFDADGNADPTQKRIRLSSVRRGFLVGIARMLETAGILSHISKGGPSGYGGQTSWQLVIAAEYMTRFIETIPTIRVKLDLVDYVPYRRSTVKVLSVTPDAPADVYCCDVKVEEHSFCAEGVIISNCTEIVSSYNGDCCNLGSLNLARITSKEELQDAVELATLFLLCGTLYSKLPVPYMHDIRTKTRRLGLGIMGVHEWLLQRGQRYGPSPDLAEWLNVYTISGLSSKIWADRLGISRPVATRSIAPNGTISIVAETTSGVEPIFAVAQKRRYLDGKEWKYQYILDPAAKRMIDRGIPPEQIEDACTLAEDVERRIDFQSWLQKYVDHGISSTINLPEWGSSLNNENRVDGFSKTLYKYLPGLRGITTYPNGSRGGQPLNRVPYTEAVKHLGEVYVEASEGNCKEGFCSS